MTVFQAQPLATTEAHELLHSNPRAVLVDIRSTSDVYFVGEGFAGDLDKLRHRGTSGGWRFRDLPREQC